MRSRRLTEFIFADMNQQYLNWLIDILGFNGAKVKCGGKGVISEFLERIKESGDELLRQRAQAGTAKTTVIVQHELAESSWKTWASTVAACSLLGDTCTIRSARGTMRRAIATWCLREVGAVVASENLAASRLCILPTTAAS